MKHKSHSKTLSLRSGFTMVELLVVITIIAVLTAIGLPAMQKMRKRSADSQCVERVRSWATVIANYSADNAGKIECRNWNSIGRESPSAYVTYFAGDGTHESGYRELEKMRCCPALKGDDAKSGNGNSLTAYAMTDPTASSDNAKTSGYSIASIKNLSRFVIMIESTGSKPYVKTPGDYTSTVLPLTTDEKGRHSDNTVNALFGDYSVQTLSGKDIKKSVTYWTTY